MLHIMKVAIGIHDITYLKNIKNNKYHDYVLTRFIPKQADEILKNESLYRIINGNLCCRQKIIDFVSNTRKMVIPVYKFYLKLKLSLLFLLQCDLFKNDVI